MESVPPLTNSLIPTTPAWRLAGRFVLSTLRGLSGCHLALTGSPVSLSHIETLRDPVAVRFPHADALVPANGRTVRLPFIRALPLANPLIALALGTASR